MVVSAMLTVFVNHGWGQEEKEGLVALYTFKEGNGNIVHDVSGVGAALDLEVANPAAISWLPDGGISFDAQILVASQDPATKIVEDCLESS